MDREIETMFWTGSPPWHGHGVGGPTTHQIPKALRLAGLDWRVERRPLQRGASPRFGVQQAVRTVDNKVLGILPQGSEPIQNEELFEFMAGLLGPDCNFVTAGSLRGGKRIWLLSTLSQEMARREAAPYLLITNRHDQPDQVTVAVVSTRVVCEQTLDQALTSCRYRWVAPCQALPSHVPAARRALRLPTYSENPEPLLCWRLCACYTSTGAEEPPLVLAPIAMRCHRDFYEPGLWLADQRPTRENQSGIHAYSYPFHPLSHRPQSYVTLLVACYGQVVVHGDGVIRAEGVRPYALVIGNDDDSLSWSPRHLTGSRLQVPCTRSLLVRLSEIYNLPLVNVRDADEHLRKEGSDPYGH